MFFGPLTGKAIGRFVPLYLDVSRDPLKSNVALFPEALKEAEKAETKRGVLFRAEVALGYVESQDTVSENEALSSILFGESRDSDSESFHFCCVVGAVAARGRYALIDPRDGKVSKVNPGSAGAWVRVG